MKKNVFYEKDKSDVFVSIFGIIGNLAIYVQAIEIFNLESSHAVSLMANLISLLSMIVWLFFGLKRKIKPLIYSNVFGIFGSIIIIIGIYIYG